MASAIMGSVGLFALKKGVELAAPVAFNLAKDASAFMNQFMAPAATSMSQSLDAAAAHKRANPEAVQFARTAGMSAMLNALRPTQAIDFTGVAAIPSAGR